MPTAIASHGALLPTASMDIGPTPTSRLVSHMVGITNTAHDPMAQALPSLLEIHASAIGQSGFCHSMMPPQAIPPPPAAWEMSWGQSNFDPSSAPLAMAPPQAAMAMTWGQRTCALPLCGGDVHAHAPAKRARNAINARLLQDLQALGPNGIQRAGGLAELARQHGVSSGSLQKLILETGRLTAKGQDKIKSEVLEIRHHPITGRLLQELSALGPDGIKRAGGVGALALQHDVSVNSLHSLILETGRLTASGQDKIKSEVLEIRHQPITNQLLQKLSPQGAAGIQRADGAGALTLQHGVSVNGLLHPTVESGRLTAVGQNKGNSEVLGLRHQPLTGQLLQELSALGPDGIQRAGGLGEWALRHGVSVNSLQSYILETGRLTAKGLDKVKREVLGLQHLPITAQLLQALSALGPDGIEHAGGVAALALQHGVSVNGLRFLIRETGDLTALGQDKIKVEVLGLQHQPITSQLLQELSALGPDGLKRAGGVGTLALQHGVSVIGLRLLIRENGSLTKRGLARIKDLPLS
jgi:hypothetical protein